MTANICDDEKDENEVEQEEDNDDYYISLLYYHSHHDHRYFLLSSVCYCHQFMATMPNPACPRVMAGRQESKDTADRQPDQEENQARQQVAGVRFYMYSHAQNKWNNQTTKVPITSP